VGDVLARVASEELPVGPVDEVDDLVVEEEGDDRRDRHHDDADDEPSA
jgi:hypothetical protein